MLIFQQKIEIYHLEINLKTALFAIYMFALNFLSWVLNIICKNK